MDKTKPFRLQLAFDPDFEADICHYLTTYRKTDRHGLVVHALRLLMAGEAFQNRFNTTLPPFETQETPVQSTIKNIDRHEGTIEDMDELMEIGKTF